MLNELETIISLDAGFDHAWEDGCHYYNYFPGNEYEPENIWVSEKPESPYCAKREVGMSYRAVAEIIKSAFNNRFENTALGLIA